MKSKKVSPQFDDSFYRLAEGVDSILKSNKDKSTQKHQVDSLLKYEELFKKEICKYAQSDEIYKQFVIYIIADKGNILSARPFFREKSKVFNKYISPALKIADIKTLKKYAINYEMVKFIVKNWIGPLPARARQYLEKVEYFRKLLVELNMPLAINRAKLFYRKVPRNSISLLDMINLCVQGLCTGIDKWSGPYSVVFRSVCIGRMTANLIDAYSQTAVHFVPDDAKILYRANSIRFRQQIENIDVLAEEINKTLEEDEKEGKKTKKITGNDLRRLLHAASPLSATPLPEDEEGDSSTSGLLDSTPSSETTQEDSICNNDVLNKSYVAIKKMDLVVVKLLKLKGVLE